MDENEVDVLEDGPGEGIGSELAAQFAKEQRSRELFHAAVQAMNGIISTGSDRGPKGIVALAFAIADEMMAEHERRNKEGEGV